MIQEKLLEKPKYKRYNPPFQRQSVAMQQFDTAASYALTTFLANLAKNGGTSGRNVENSLEPGSDVSFRKVSVRSVSPNGIKVLATASYALLDTAPDLTTPQDILNILHSANVALAPLVASVTLGYQGVSNNLVRLATTVRPNCTSDMLSVTTANGLNRTMFRADLGYVHSARVNADIVRRVAQVANLFGVGVR